MEAPINEARRRPCQVAERVGGEGCVEYTGERENKGLMELLLCGPRLTCKEAAGEGESQGRLHTGLAPRPRTNTSFIQCAQRFTVFTKCQYNTTESWLLFQSVPPACCAAATCPHPSSSSQSASSAHIAMLPRALATLRHAGCAVPSQTPSHSSACLAAFSRQQSQSEILPSNRLSYPQLRAQRHKDIACFTSYAYPEYSDSLPTYLGSYDHQKHASTTDIKNCDPIIPFEPHIKLPRRDRFSQPYIKATLATN
ncbi:hypothetical protein AOQ84DRAFT_223588 [Glonium stellatum]|uniref:Uncharacterized protein n=1 Tax=Glonium stellatum TaxID=574774 RepID=A0A8E2JR85_9PEZI|nr:hypothetical protein AOQ84DRAFT_223588 [Glonium stellatum]